MGKGPKGSAGGFRLFPGRFKFRPPVDTCTDGALRKVATARGLSSVDELLASLGKSQTGVSSTEALDLMEKEVGLDAVHDHVMSNYYSSDRKRCQRLLKSYSEIVNSTDSVDRALARVKHEFLMKYCDYHGDNEK